MVLSKALGIVSGINEVGNFLQLFGSTISYLRSRWNNGEQEQQIQEHQVQEQQIQEHDVQEQQIQEHEVLQLHSDLQILSDTLPSTYNLIDRAEWRSHERCVALILPKLKDAVYDAEDLLDEFRWYELKVSIEGNNSTQLLSVIEFFRSVTRGSFNKVTDIQKRLSNLSSQLEKMGLLEATPRFDKSVRPVTTSFPTEAKIFGRENEIAEIVRLLGVPNSSSRSPPSLNINCNAANSELRETEMEVLRLLGVQNNNSRSSSKRKRAASVPVLSIVGLGGVGKTTLAQEITWLPSVKSHFDKIIWICVSDEFDVERFTKVLVTSLSGKEAAADNFDDLQQVLAHEVGKKRFLLILDDIWPGAAKEDGKNWRRFCAPLKNLFQGSMLLVTTRFEEVADTVGTTEYFALDGLKPGIFWEFFKSCVFGSENYHIDPQLEQIGRNIVPKLKGSPLAARTIGRLLQKSLTTKHWNDILNSELWWLEQHETDILPALRLSYMYLPFHLKRCFSFCAVYPKDYNFRKDTLVEIWVAEGFVEPQGNMSVQHVGEQYFEDLVNLSFFQRVNCEYVIHDLMHDMAQLVSKDECFIVKASSDIEKVPHNVRHLTILASSVSNFDNLASLCKHKKLRTLICQLRYCNKVSVDQVIYLWFSELQCLRVISLPLPSEIPEDIGNMKHLRYLKTTTYSSKRLPSSFCCLYNLQIFYAWPSVFESLPSGFGNLINLEKFDATIQAHTLDFDTLDWKYTFWLIKNIAIEDLTINNVCAISKDHAAQMGLRYLDYLNYLSLTWSSLRSQEHTETIEVLEALHPPTNIKSIHLEGYPGEYLPWDCFFSSLTKLSIVGSQQLSNLENFLQPGCVPAMKKLTFESCPRLSIKSAKVGALRCLEELMVYDCPDIILQGFFPPYLKKLTLKKSRNLEGNLMSVLDVGMWSLPTLLELTIIGFNSVTFSNGHIGSIFPSLTELSINGSKELSSLEQFLQPDCVPAIKKIAVENCLRLSVESAKVAEFCCLEELMVCDCPNISSRRIFSPYLKKLTLKESRNLGGNLMSVLDLGMWSLPALLELTIIGLNSLTFISKANISHHSGSSRSTGAFSSLTDLTIESCSNLNNMDVLLSHECLPAIRRICISHCAKLLLPGVRWNFSSLRNLEIVDCPHLQWQSGTVLPSSLQRLSLRCCGNISSCFPSCLEDLTSLQSLEIVECEHIVTIPGHLWKNNLPSLKKLEIMRCPNLVSIGGPNAIAHISWVSINTCPKLHEIDQPKRLHQFWLLYSVHP